MTYFAGALICFAILGFLGFAACAVGGKADDQTDHTLRERELAITLGDAPHDAALLRARAVRADGYANDAEDWTPATFAYVDVPAADVSCDVGGCD